ncbi:MULTISPECIES: CRISPR-associated endonuclease Cas2 [unclassified Corynebacterium]|nr:MULTISPECIES: CRISPR-associated endonuclease Cas2 [Corynebacterium]
MWCLVMFDLPVTTKQERKEATKFRNYLLDSGFSMVQFSVYVQYLPLGVNLSKIASSVKGRLPAQGEVRLVPITDKQWSEAFRFSNRTELRESETPEQLQIF